MILSVEHVLDIEGERVTFAGKLDLQVLKRHGEALFHEQLAVDGTVQNQAGVVILRYQISGDLHYSCDRCLMQTNRPLLETFEHTVVRSLVDEQLDDVFLVVPQGKLNLTEIASSDLLLYLPQGLLCREDCKGLCSVCGTDLNETSCGCQTPKVDAGLSKLKTLLD